MIEKSMPGIKSEFFNSSRAFVINETPGAIAVNKIANARDEIHK
ncbi:hypothetical protein [Nostoc sp.]